MLDGEQSRNQTRKVVVCPICEDVFSTRGEFSFVHCGKTHAIAHNMFTPGQPQQKQVLSSPTLSPKVAPSNTPQKAIEVEVPKKDIRTVYRKCLNCGSSEIVTAQTYKEICGMPDGVLEGEEELQNPTVCLKCEELFEG